jgi:hypothetical protein
VFSGIAFSEMVSWAETKLKLAKKQMVMAIAVMYFMSETFVC